ncbi:MAG TPA: cyclase family protein [Solirubrobacteraceae bacterium]|jgi:kynurenine formamidase
MTLIHTKRLWDLSQPVYHDAPAWAEYDPPNLTRNYRRQAEGFNAETLTLNTHTGTHVDVPYHFDDGGPTIDQMPLTAFAAPAVFLDLRARVRAGNPIGPDAFDGILQQLQQGDIAVLVTGWGPRRAVSEEYLKRWPYLDGEGAKLLLDHGISGVGIDALSIGGWGGPEKGEPSHAALLGAGKIVIEELYIPDELIGRRCFLTAFPVLLQGCGGAWTRAVAWELDG